MKTTKIYLASALVSLGAGIKNVDKSDPRHMEFHLTYSAPFTGEKDWFDAHVKEWENRTLIVNAQEFVDAIQNLKSEVHRT